MKILNANAGPLTNFEVLDFLRSKGAGKDPTRVLARVTPSEYKVFDYLNQTPASYQTREAIFEFVDKSKKYDLAKAEILNILNLRPVTPVEMYSVIEQSEVRMGDNVIEELAEMVERVFPAPQIQPTSEEVPTEGKEDEVTNEKTIVGDDDEEHQADKATNETTIVGDVGEESMETR